MSKRMTIALISILSLLALVSCSASAGSSPPVPPAPSIPSNLYDASQIVPDKTLESIIREAISKPEGAITKSDLAGVTAISADRQPIFSLKGIQGRYEMKFYSEFCAVRL